MEGSGKMLVTAVGVHSQVIKRTQPKLTKQNIPLLYCQIKKINAFLP